MINTNTTITPGTIFYSSWGYEQTNIDFYEVVRVTTKTVTLRPIGASRTETISAMSGTVTPKPGEFTGQEFRRTIINYGDAPMVRINAIANASLWEGKPLFTSSWY
ncbi:hypothetical protein [Lysinibacter sp. HNR]|uniref:hypothetical protein n=1 Tax=Lysinibacter sp. HNR TaxID=3031408 RepID=UPI0024358E7C|nr:hypothetical protein [Lysinibacter sp. HNR]WGD37569.1 hypothetical protein FrondiHNR_01195 [Lysinibacter sp. HNR]